MKSPTTENTRELLQWAGIQYVSFSSMRELRSNESLFLKKYINYEFDNNIWTSTIIWKSCHESIEMFYCDYESLVWYGKDPDVTKQKIIKFWQDYAKEQYIQKNQKPNDFWNTKTMISFWGYEDLRKLVDEYKTQADIIKDLKDLWELESSNKTLEAIEDKIQKVIKKHKKKDWWLDDFIKWWATGDIDKIMDGIQKGMTNWFTFVYPKIKDWKLIATEYNTTTDVEDLTGAILALPIKTIIDAVFQDENGEYVIVDWKFKSQLTDGESIKPDYDMQGATYIFGLMGGMRVVAKRAIFIEIQPMEAKAPYMQQAELRDLCKTNEIDRENGNNGKWMTNGLMQDELIKKGVIQLKQVINEYTIDFSEKIYLLEMWTVWYKQTINRLFQLLVVGDDFIPNIFDGNFGGGVIAYQEWMKDFLPASKTPEFTDADAVDL